MNIDKMQNADLGKILVGQNNSEGLLIVLHCSPGLAFQKENQQYKLSFRKTYKLKSNFKQSFKKRKDGCNPPLKENFNNSKMARKFL